MCVGCGWQPSTPDPTVCAHHCQTTNRCGGHCPKTIDTWRERIARAANDTSAHSAQYTRSYRLCQHPAECRNGNWIRIRSTTNKQTPSFFVFWLFLSLSLSLALRLCLPLLPVRLAADGWKNPIHSVKLKINVAHSQHFSIRPIGFG